MASRPFPAPCRRKRPARTAGYRYPVRVAAACTSGLIIPLSCTVTDSSVLSTPAANRCARILDIRFRRVSVKTCAFFCSNCLCDQPLAGRQLYTWEGSLEQVIFPEAGKITCDMAQIDLIFCW